MRRFSQDISYKAIPGAQKWGADGRIEHSEATGVLCTDAEGMQKTPQAFLTVEFLGKGQTVLPTVLLSQPPAGLVTDGAVRRALAGT